MKKNIDCLPSALILLILSHGVVAADMDSGQAWKSRWYAGAGLGVSRLNPDPNGTIFRVSDDKSFGYKLTLGYDWSKRISIEGYYADLGEAKLSPRGRIEYRHLGLSGLYHFYQQETPHRGFEALAKVGVGNMHNTADVNFERVNDVHLSFGLGAGYGFDNGLMLRADLDLFDEDAQFLSLNLIKRFGGERSARRKAQASEEQPPAEQPRYSTQAAPAPQSARDGDADGVVDAQDACPGTPSGAQVGPRGCATRLLLRGVTFEHDSARLTARAQAVLERLAKQLAVQGSARRILIIGHTDASGGATYNMHLSRQRAASVRRYLVERGVDAARLSAEGRGETQPIADNATAAGRARNRRVELHWEQP